jgi:hypothetical protein
VVGRSPIEEISVARQSIGGISWSKGRRAHWTCERDERGSLGTRSIPV